MAIALGGECIGAALAFARRDISKAPVTNDAFCSPQDILPITILELVTRLMQYQPRPS
jgi:hypothetical protein